MQSRLRGQAVEARGYEIGDTSSGGEGAVDEVAGVEGEAGEEG